MKRRQFLILGSLAGLGVAAVGKTVHAGLSATPITETTNTTENLRPNEDVLNDRLLLRFVAIADSGTGADGQYAVAKAMSQYLQSNPFPLVLMAGDNIYNNGEIKKIKHVFEQPYAPLLQQGVKFYAVLGNHDIRTENGNPQVEYSGFNMKGRYYTFRRGGVQFFALDTNDNADWDAELPWLEAELRRSTAPWKVVFAHNQIYSSGRYGVNQPFVQRLTPLFRRYGVQLYVNGHDHHYERTIPIHGTTYLTCGASAGVRDSGRSRWTVHSASRLSFAAFDVYPNRMVIKGIGTDGTVFDRGMIPRYLVKR